MGVRVREAGDRADFDACVRLQREVWGLADLEITPAIQLLATVHAGGLLLVAESPGEGIVGFAYAFPALGKGEGHLHSDMLAVHPAARGRGVGAALKWAQRDGALRRGLRLVTWTFDPMRAGNARLNLHRLGAVSRELLPDFYGETSSALHHGLPTDRLLVRWEIGSERVRARAEGRDVVPSGEGIDVNEVTFRDGLPFPAPPRLDGDDARLALAIPADWDAVCQADLSLARAWQATVRAAFEALFARGYAAVDCRTGPGGLARYLLRTDVLGG